MGDDIGAGDYVLATKYSDGDASDAWGIGFYSGFKNGRHHIINSAGEEIRPSGYRRVVKISRKMGDYILSNKDEIEIAGINLYDLVTTE